MDLLEQTPHAKRDLSVRTAQSLRHVFLDMHLPDWTRPGQSGEHASQLKDVAARFDVDALVHTFTQAHVNLVVFFAKCQYGNFYYDTHIGHKHTGLGNLDLLGEFLPRACRRNQGHRLLLERVGCRGRACASRLDDAERARADLLSPLPRVCFNSPYRELVHSHLSEMFSRYPLDGIWMDMLHLLPCYCPRCQSKFETQIGSQMPRHKSGQAWLQLVRWQQTNLDEYIIEARAIVKRLNPDAVFTLNFYGSPYAEPSSGLAIQHLDRCDYVSTEGYTEWHGLLFPSYSTRYLRAAARTKPVEVLISRFLRTWDFTLAAITQLKFEAFSVAANGAAVCLDDEPYHDGQIEPQVYWALSEVYRGNYSREPYLLDTTPIYYAGCIIPRKRVRLPSCWQMGKPPARAQISMALAPSS